MQSLSPINDTVLLASLALFTKVSLILSSLVGAIFIIRMTLLSLRIAGTYEYLEVISDTAKYFALTYLFPVFIEVILGTTSALASAVAYAPVTEAQKSIEEFAQKLFGDFVLMQIFGRVGDILMQLFIQSIYTVLICLLLAIAPVMIFLSTMLGLSQGVSAYFGSFLSLSLWPVLWNLLGLLGRELWPHISESPASSAIFWVVIQVLQLFSPIFCVILFKNLSPTQSLSKVITLIG